MTSISRFNNLKAAARVEQGCYLTGKDIGFFEQIPSAKTPVMDSFEDPAQSLVIRSSIWLADGNIVLQAGNMQFRVYRGMLAQHSSVFRDMCSFPEPPENHEALVDGCPLVHLTDDAQDLQYLLSALFENSFHLTADKLALAFVAALLRLGRKYAFDELRQMAVDFLSESIPTTYDNWVACKGDLFTRIAHYAGIEFDLANLLRENGLHALLPCALYLCLGYDLDVILYGTRAADGEKLHILSEEDRMLCALAREKVNIARYRFSNKWMLEDSYCLPAVGCKSIALCSQGRRDIFSEVFASPMGFDHFGLDEFRVHHFHRRLCTACLNEAALLHEEGRQAMWERLPSEYFGLPSWGTYTDTDS